jgi:hypothetical protein
VNLVTIAALGRSKELRKKPATCFILSLALCDLIFCLTVLPVDATTLLTDYNWSSADGYPGPTNDKATSDDRNETKQRNTFTMHAAKALCFFSGLTKHSAAMVDWSTLGLIAVERYMMIFSQNK